MLHRAASFGLLEFFRIIYEIFQNTSQLEVRDIAKIIK